MTFDETTTVSSSLEASTSIGTPNAQVQELPLEFSWDGPQGYSFKTRPFIAGSEIKIRSGSVKSNVNFFAAGVTPALLETVERFSALRRTNRIREFSDAFMRQFTFISDLDIEVNAAQPMIYATLAKDKLRLPISAVSGGINRILSICIAIAYQPNSIIIVDEMEDGLFHTRKSALWKTTLDLAFQQNAQLFVTTHDEEWLKGLVEVVEDSQIEEIALWRFQRNDQGETEFRQFSGDLLKAAIEAGQEVR